MRLPEKPDLLRWTPPGGEALLKRERRLLLWGWSVSFLFSLLFWTRYAAYYHSLYEYNSSLKEYVLIPGAQMPSFRFLLTNSPLGHTMACFVLLAVLMLVLIVGRYHSFYEGSRSIYLMKRLPDRWELHRRCLPLPLLAALLVLLSAAALTLLYFGLYLLITPSACLPPNVWQ